MLPGLGFAHLAVVALVALLVLGPDKLPDLAQRAGRAHRELQQLRERLDLDLEALLDREESDPADDDGASSRRPAVTPQRALASAPVERGTVRPARHHPPSHRG